MGRSINIKVESNVFLEIAYYLENPNISIEDDILSNLDEKERNLLENLRADFCLSYTEFVLYSNNNIADYLELFDNISVDDFYYYFHHETIRKDEIEDIDLEVKNDLKKTATSLFKKTIPYVESMVAEKSYEHRQEEVFKMLHQFRPLEVAQKTMGKTFTNISDYVDYSFYIVSNNTLGPMRIFNDKSLAVIMPLEHLQKDYSIQELEEILKIVSDSTRLKMIQLLSKKPMYGKQIADELGLKAPTVTHHIEQLKKIGLLYLEQKGQSKYYSLNHLKYKEIVRALLKITT